MAREAISKLKKSGDHRELTEPRTAVFVLFNSVSMKNPTFQFWSLCTVLHLY